MYNKAIEEVLKRGNISTEEFEREKASAKGLCDNDRFMVYTVLKITDGKMRMRKKNI